jgi:LemA protein
VALLVTGIVQWSGHDDIGLATDEQKRRLYQGLTLTGAGGLVAFIGAYLVAWIIMVFNDLVELRNRVRKQLANIDVQLKRRADLVLSLVACVEGLRRHESDLQTAIAQLRAQAALRDHTDPRIQSLQRMDRAMAILVERYPALVAADAFLRLQKELSDTEERIALARDDANGITAGFNARIGTFPASLIASGMGFRTMPFFSADLFERAVPRVSGLRG